MKTDKPTPKRTARKTCKNTPENARGCPLERSTVQALSEHEKDKLRAEALALCIKGREQSGDDTFLLSRADSDRMKALVRCGMLPGDPPPPQLITRGRVSELREIARKRNEAATPAPELHRLALKIQAAGGREKARPADLKKFDALIEKPGKAGGFVPASFNSPEERERMEKHRAELATAAIYETMQGRKTTDTKRARKAGEASGKERIAKRGDCIENHRAEFEALRKPRADGSRMSARSAGMIIGKKYGFHFDKVAERLKHPNA